MLRNLSALSWDPTMDQAAWSRRPDGSLKGMGFLGPLALPNGDVATEYSIADSEKLKDAQGNYLDYPSLVPTLTRDEVQAVLRAAADSSGKTKIPDSVYTKAEAFALQRRAQGKPLFATWNEQNTRLYPDLPRLAYQDRPVPSHRSLSSLSDLADEITSPSHQWFPQDAGLSPAEAAALKRRVQTFNRTGK